MPSNPALKLPGERKAEIVEAVPADAAYIAPLELAGRIVLCVTCAACFKIWAQHLRRDSLASR